MYRLETYVKMCEKAKEIQSLSHDQFSFIYSKKSWKDDNGLTVVFWEGPESQRYLNGEKLIWLPRQDQLQEMVKTEDLFKDLSTFYSFSIFYCMDRLEDTKNLKISMEQLWLAFVMKEKYNKVWDGEDWILQK